MKIYNLYHVEEHIACSHPPPLLLSLHLSEWKHKIGGQRESDYFGLPNTEEDMNNLAATKT